MAKTNIECQMVYAKRSCKVLKKTKGKGLRECDRKEKLRVNL